ncbi:MAG: hypothetical protein H6948_05385 [Zoogloeaceae bacterium]|nr:hypothetical protein [Zoogloeaceae bacterium]
MLSSDQIRQLTEKRLVGGNWKPDTNMVSIRVTHPCWVQGVPREVGDPVTVQQWEADQVIGLGRAKYA